MKGLKSKTVYWSLIGLLVVGLILYFGFYTKPILVESALVEKGNFIKTLESDAIIRSKLRYVVPAFADGDLRRINLKVGDLIEKKQILGWLNWDVRDEPIRAPIRGVISKIYRESAGPVRRGEPIVELVDHSQLEVMVELLTADAAQVSIGSPFELISWGGSHVLRGTITKISKAGYLKWSALGVEEERTEVTGNFDSDSMVYLKTLGDHYHADIRIFLESHENVLLIPLGALFRKGERWAVYQIKGKSAREIEVNVIDRTQTVAQVDSGVTAGDRLILYPGDRIKNGTKVRE